MKTYNCPNCGAALPAHAIKTEVATCEFCNTSFRISKTPTPQPDMGDLLLGADFSNKIMPGWEVLNGDKLTFHKNPLEMRGFLDPDPNKAWYVLRSSGFLDDFDASLNIRFLEGRKESIRAGFYLRFTDDGGYGFLISAQASYTIGAFTKDADGKLVWQKKMGWAYHTALKPGFNETNRLRVICNHESFRVYMNGVLTTSFKDSLFSAGTLYLAADTGEGPKAGFAFSDLQVREVPG